eukprot:SAG11_NODE_10748_length_808_cov_0.873061_2_plen_128_part_01
MIEAVNHAAETGGHVLFHCTIGYRTGAFPTALLGLITEGMAAGAMLSTDVLMNRMHRMGYDTADEQTAHRFEIGTNALFGGLESLQFTGTVNEETGVIDGSVGERESEDTEAPAPAPAPENSSPPPPP